jgi:hypothetical protein
MAKSPPQQLLPLTIKTTRDLRISLIETYQDLLAKRITPHEARARAIAARAILDTVRTELVLARANLTDYRTINLLAPQQENVETKKKV